VLGSGRMKILYSWRKNLNLNTVIGTNNLVFTPALRDSFVLMDGKLQPFVTRRSFIRLFPQGQRAEIKSYMRKHKVKMKKASDKVMEEMITFIGNLK